MKTEEDFVSIIINNYQKELTAFYSPYFDSVEKRDHFVSVAFNYDTELDKARFMIHQIERFVTLADDIDSIRPGRDSLRVLFLKTCLESLCSISEKKKNTFFGEFEKCISEEGKAYILDNFKFTGVDIPESLYGVDRILFDTHENYNITISDFLNVIKAVRDNVVHDGDYWTMQFFARDNDSSWFVEFSTDEGIISCQSKGEMLTYHFETKMKYENFRFFFVEACIKYVMNYMEANLKALFEV